MSGASGEGAEAVPNQAGEKPEAGRVRPLAVMSHAAAHSLLMDWAAVELGEIRKVWYPAAAMGYRDWQPPRDPETRQEREIRRAERDDALVSRVGWCVLTLKEPHRRALRRFYLGGSVVGRGARDLALAAFVRRWEEWSEVLDGEPMGAQ